MTSLLSPPGTAGTPTCATAGRWCCSPLLGGAVAAAGTLVVCLALGVAGWFLADAGAHGAPRDGLRVGALGLADGPRLRRARRRRRSSPSSRWASPLVCAWVVWRLGLRVGRLGVRARTGRRPDRRRRARLDRAGRHRALRGWVHRRGRGRPPLAWRPRRDRPLGRPGGALVARPDACLVAGSGHRRRAPAGPRSGPRVLPDRGPGRRSAAAGGSSGGSCVVSAVALLGRAAARPRVRGERAVPAAHRCGRVDRRSLALSDAGRAQRDRVRRRPTCSAPASPSASARWSRRPWSCSARCRCSPCWPRCPTPARRPAWTAWLLAVPPAGGAPSGRRPRPAPRTRRGAGARARCAAAPVACSPGSASRCSRRLAGRRGRPGTDAGGGSRGRRRAGARGPRLRHRRARRRTRDDLVAASPTPVLAA